MGSSPLLSDRNRKGPTQLSTTDSLPAGEPQSWITTRNPRGDVEELSDSQNTSNFKPKRLALGPDRTPTHDPMVTAKDNDKGETKVKRGFWVCFVRKFKAAFMKTNEPLNHENFTRTIEIVLKINGNEVKRNARALFDAGCQENLVAREFLENQFHVSLGSSVGGLTFTMADGRDLETICSITGRWAATASGLDRTMPNQKLYFDTKFYEDSFYIPEREGLPFDVVIGLGTIMGSDLLRCRPLACLGWRRRAPPSVKDRELQEASEKQKMAIAENDKLKAELIQEFKSTGGSKCSFQKTGYITPPD